jgi:hypothetical protein
VWFFVFVVMRIGDARFAVVTTWLPEPYPTPPKTGGLAFSTTMSRFVAAAGTAGGQVLPD